MAQNSEGRPANPAIPSLHHLSLHALVTVVAVGVTVLMVWTKGKDGGLKGEGGLGEEEGGGGVVHDSCSTFCRILDCMMSSSKIHSAWQLTEAIIEEVSALK